MSEQFAGDAFVEIKPDLSGFLVELNAKTLALKPKPVVVPVVVAGGPQVVAAQQAVTASTAQATKAATAAIPAWAAYGAVLDKASLDARDAAAASTQLGVAQQAATTKAADAARRRAASEKAATAATREAAREQKNRVRQQAADKLASDKLAAAQTGIVNATTSVATAQIRLTASTAAVTAARARYQLLLKTGTFEEIRAARNAIVLAKAYQVEAAAALESAAANATRASSLRTGARGAAATLLSLLGIRGATLAASGTFLAGAAAVTLFVRSLRSAAKLQTELATFRATTGALADEMIRVSEAAIRLGGDITLPGVTAQDAAVAMTSLAKAGLSVEESIAGARGVLQLATAAQISNADAAKIAAGALNSFGLAGDQAVRVADTLANASVAAQGSIEDMGVALGQAAAVARQVGISMEDTVAILTLLAKNGLAGSDAGTSLRTAMLRLVNPTKEAAGFIELLNIQVRDLNGNVRPDVFAQFTEATRALSPAMRDAIIATVFGTDAIRAVAIAGREGADGLRLMQFQVDQQGTAAELAGARTSGLTGALGALGNAIDTSSTKLGGKMVPAVTTMVVSFTEFAEAIDTVISQLGKLSEIDDILIEIGIIPDFGDKDDKVKGAIGDFVKEAGRFAIGGPVVTASRLLGGGGDETAAEIAVVTESLKKLQEMRISLERETPGLGATLTPEIERLKRDLAELQRGPVALGPPAPKRFKQLDVLGAQLEEVRALRKKALEEDPDTSAYKKAIAEILNEMKRLRTDSEEEMGKIDFSELSTNLQAVLRGFRLDPDGEHAQKFLQEAKRLVGQLSKLEPQAGIEGQRIGRAVLKSIRDAMRVALQAGDADTVAQLKAYSKRLAEAFEGALAEDFANINITVGFTLSEKSAIEEATGASNSARIARLRRDRARLQEDIDRLTAVPRSQLTQAQREKLARKSIARNQVDAEIQSILEEQARGAEDQAQAIVTARNDADQKVINELAGERGRVERLLERAGLNKGLKDDIKFTEKLQEIIRGQIKEANKRIKDAKTRNEVKKQLNDRLLQLERDRKRLEADLADQLRQQREAREAALERNLELRIDLAVERGNTTGEKRARLKFISFLQDQINDLKKVKKKTQEQRNAILELQIEIARQRNALKELGATSKGRNDEFRKLTFQFLQMQQGFAANLFGNLIPGLATGGLVGGGGGNVAGTTGGPLLGGTPSGAEGFGGALGGTMIRDKALSSKSSPSGGQLTELIAVNRQMLKVLHRLAGDAKHPEAKHSKMSSRAMLDMLG